MLIESKRLTETVEQIESILDVKVNGQDRVELTRSLCHLVMDALHDRKVAQEITAMSVQNLESED